MGAFSSVSYEISRCMTTITTSGYSQRATIRQRHLSVLTYLKRGYRKLHVNPSSRPAFFQFFSFLVFSLMNRSVGLRRNPRTVAMCGCSIYWVFLSFDLSQGLASWLSASPGLRNMHGMAYHSKGVFLRIVLLSYIVNDEDMMSASCVDFYLVDIRCSTPS